MKAKKYLSEIHLQRNRCKILEEQAEQLRCQIEGVKGITYDKDKVQTSVTNAVEDQLAKLIDIERQYTKALAEFNTMFLHREKQIAQMGKPEYIRILQLRYLETDNGQRLSLEKIAVLTHWSYDHVRHLHGEALAAFGRKYLGQ